MQPPQDDDTTDLLDPVPAVRTGDLVGYACVDKKSGKNAEREELW
ncbi:MULTISPECIES: hypothetical protein [unclassified Streptomyces]|nr:hypothetical protein [Streptomyces sp. NBC_00562]WUC17895.1 hypothetical protein OHA33_02825 [Streptomyces sp. NBC_00562]